MILLMRKVMNRMYSPTTTPLFLIGDMVVINKQCYLSKYIGTISKITKVMVNNSPHGGCEYKVKDIQQTLWEHELTLLEDITRPDNGEKPIVTSVSETIWI
jgi:hypothetical protein